MACRPAHAGTADQAVPAHHPQPQGLPGPGITAVFGCACLLVASSASPSSPRLSCACGVRHRHGYHLWVLSALFSPCQPLLLIGNMKLLCKYSSTLSRENNIIMNILILVLFLQGKVKITFLFIFCRPYIIVCFFSLDILFRSRNSGLPLAEHWPTLGFNTGLVQPPFKGWNVLYSPLQLAFAHPPIMFISIRS